MKIRKGKGESIGFGGTIVIVVFILLCLMILSVLSFSTAYSDFKLSAITREKTEDYYEIHGKSEEKLKNIYEILLLVNSRNSNNDAMNFYKSTFEEFKKIGIEAEYKGDYICVSFETEGEMNQKISSEINIYYDDKKNQPYYDIVSWKLSNINLPKYDDDILDLWEGIEDEDN